ncbi:hypothetical protein C349_06191 [Cryptococcus neoformans var. grubii Br795]|uniref:Uncharacterized protein n=1 Tax=Cryptococcus neoformans Tu259-1 TaxID=1230072 RepID=A0A854QFS5_CRYNE|nr:hypothetical protein C353_06131 [Cryptococcus neoformans var. grubii AD1-83a]OWZ56163.1 hypothetical protein C368_01787 [Cryptococcus neoformans var. grubii 125.91]OXG25017.1 hypothetical protein C361_02018 [Cryptococcus neoformans var. grubii Tu259-1]OXG45033.1 hypothetical protein C355_06140 [Cryptococcus neoformans var. grubii Th84]OXG48190.1 hypothetical protein C354_06133 [Cryptococcus neoformans var. grubii MW-RSA1955]OXG51847.1 hypothetical protein C352_06135 [Cryptococcus neoformans
MAAQPPEQTMPGGFPTSSPQDTPEQPDQYFYKDQQPPSGGYNPYTSNTSPAPGNSNNGAGDQQEAQPLHDYFQHDQPNSPAIHHQPLAPDPQSQPLPPQVQHQYPSSQAPQHQWPPPDPHYHHHAPHQVYSPRQDTAACFPTRNYEDDDEDRSYRSHRRVKRYGGRKESEKPQQIQIITQGQDTGSSSAKIADQMQMMMVNQMMMQQMQSQQMQAAQMAAMTQKTFQTLQNSGNNNNQNRNQNNDREPRKRNRKSKPAVNIQTIQHMSMRKRSPKTKAIRAASPQGPEIVVLQPPLAGSPAPPVIAPPTAEYVDNMALDNWQEATIILCFAAIGIIYLICSRANGSDDGNEKKPDLAKKHLS